MPSYVLQALRGVGWQEGISSESWMTTSAGDKTDGAWGVEGARAQVTSDLNGGSLRRNSEGCRGVEINLTYKKRSLDRCLYERRI